jgi:hypothetical protein
MTNTQILFSLIGFLVLLGVVGGLIEMKFYPTKTAQ